MTPFPMKKTLLTLSTLAACCAQAAGSGVEIFGTVDLGVTHLGGSGDSKAGLSTGAANISRLGFRGTEDLGGGLQAGFWLEAGMDPDSGAGKGSDGGLSFNRRATVSLSGGFGELRFGRDDSATFLNTLIFDPFITNGVGGTNAFTMLGIPGLPTAAGGAPIQISNAISYLLPKELGGWYGQAQMALGEQPRNSPEKNRGNYFGLRGGYRQGALHVAGSGGKLYGDAAANNLSIANLAASYDLGAVTPLLLVAQEKRGTRKITAVQLGARMPVGPNGILRASLGHYNSAGNDADWRKFSLGYGHNLSKRTQLYSSLAWLKNRKGASRSIGVQGLPAPGTTPGGNAHGVEFGLRHFF